MQQYLQLLNEVKEKGRTKEDRTGTGTTSVFGRQIRFDLREGFPMLTTKKLHLPSIVHELLWIVSGDTNIGVLKQNGVRIWNEWANEAGELGPLYGAQWRHWKDARKHGMGVVQSQIDQLALAIKDLKENPDSRRIVVTAWNPSVLPAPGVAPQEQADLGLQALAPCHCLFQFYSEELGYKERVELAATMGYTPRAKSTVKTITAKMEELKVPKRALSCQLYQRSADIFLGVPFNVASYSLLTMMIAKLTGHVAKEFVHTFGDLHLYLNHKKQADEQLSRKPSALPKMIIHGDQKSIDDFKFEDFELVDYSAQKNIPAPVSV